MGCVELILSLGHELLGCITNNEAVKQLCENEEIYTTSLDNLSWIYQQNFDFCIVLNDIILESNIFSQTAANKWISLVNQSALESLKRDFSTILSYSPPLPKVSWYTVTQENKLVYVKQSYLPLDLNEFDSFSASFYQLLVDLSRDNLELETIYHEKSKTLPLSISQALNKLENKLNVNGKILLLAAFYGLLNKYFTFLREKLRIGIVSNKFCAKSSFLQESFYLHNIAINLLDYESLVKHIFQDVVVKTFQQSPNTLTILDKSTTTIALTFCFSADEDFTHSIYYPSLYLEFVFNDKTTAIKASYFKDCYNDEFVISLLNNFAHYLESLLQDPAPNLLTASLPNINAAKIINIDKQESNVILSFRKLAKADPLKVALIEDDRQYTYQHLLHAANAISNHLTLLNIPKNSYIPVIAKRGFELIASLIGIIQTGCCIVPINPKLPEEKVKEIIAITAASIVLADDINITTIKAHLPEINTIIINDLLRTPTPDNIKLRNIEGKDPVYLIFTSGTTGTPKGVVIENASLFDRLTWLSETLALDHTYIGLHHTNIGFDVAIEEIFLPLINGGQLVIAPQNINEKIELFPLLIQKHKVNFIEFVPSLLKLLLELNYISACSSLRYVVSGSEALDFAVMNAFYCASKATLINLYGPTECTINATYHICRPDEIRRSRYVPIGKAVKNVELFVLDDKLNNVPLGGIGELYVSGSGLALGYLRSNLHIEDCCKVDSQQRRIYKTGDLVRYIDDSELEFIGRVDRQIKLRGYRIELEEVEFVLAQYPCVKRSAVVLVENSAHKKQLVAFFNIKPASELYSSCELIEELNLFCSKHLPDYMVPSRFHQVDSMPLSQNGKIDYAALLKLSQNNSLEPTSSRLASNNLEALIQSIWSTVLAARVQLDDHFFDLGGNSLLAVQAVAMLLANNIKVNVGDIFQYPTITKLATFLNANKLDTTVQLTITPKPRTQRMPLSYAQQRLWYLYQLEGKDNAAYNMAMVFSLKGKFNLYQLNVAINQLIKRHEILRTLFKSQEGNPWQEILPYNQVEFTIEQVARQRLKYRLIEETHTPFNIEEGPLSRFKIFKLSSKEHILAITMHNIITDGWSDSIIIHEINTVYTALHKDVNCNIDTLLPIMPFQYADYAFWQRQIHNPSTLKNKIDYWVNKLKDFTELVLFPETDNDEVAQSGGKDFKFNLNNPNLVKNLHQLAQELHTTPYVVLITTFNILLAQYSNLYDIVIGTGMAGRETPGLDKLIGFFVNTIVLRNDLAGNPTFADLIQKVHSSCVEAHLYQDVPFEMIVDALMLERDSDKNPIFQVLFIMQKTGDDVALKLPLLETTNILVDRKTATFGITFNLELTDSGLLGDIQYNSAKYTYKNIKRFFNDFHMLLETFIAAPTQHIQSVNVLRQEELDTLLHKWNETDTALSNEYIHHLFELAARKYPSNPAISYLDFSLTYQELNARANQLSHYICKKLAAANLPHKQVIGIFLDRGIDFIVSMLAVLKSGNIFMPLDPSYPLARLEYFINNAKASLIISLSSNPHSEIFTANYNLILLDKESALIAKQDIVNIAAQPCDHCYIIFTSGSTGKPKGVLIKHNSVINLLLSMQQHLQVSQNDRLLSVTSVNFDIFYLESLLPLISHATCILADKDAVNDMNIFMTLINKVKPTIMQATPSFWRLLINDLGSQQFNCKILTGGEPLLPDLAKQLLQTFAELFNVYGPTETTIWSTIKKIESEDDVSIGKPIANTKCYVLNEYLNPVPINVPGELYIGGAGLADGYLNDNEGTQKSFISNPFVDKELTKYARLYKTGDFVRFRSNKEIEYIARTDQQIKLRGYRVELAEIETHLLSHQGIKEAAVVLRRQKDDKGDFLVAFYTTTNAISVDNKLLQVYLAQILPIYMIPNKWVQLANMPKTFNGKLDRKRLDEMELQVNPAGTPLITQIDHQLATIWGTILDIDISAIAADDSFFMLGGHSLLIPQVVSKINTHFASRITIRDFIQNPTIEKLGFFITHANLEPTCSQHA
ncbi:MAG: hypothetical protein A3F18_05490 [Legionellales bacterium RIFCSPHIGHO2_12_FULL_37_14]|nr:MAG: hypothetical protein A3F18_05490 [Legionellales bacterium RIFCSPHIGHO2_12_FULL_37_14]